MYDDTKEEVFLIMKLSTAILADKLKSKFGLQNKKALSDELHLEQVLFYDDGDEMQPGQNLYLYPEAGRGGDAGGSGADSTVLHG